MEKKDSIPTHVFQQSDETAGQGRVPSKGGKKRPKARTGTADAGPESYDKAFERLQEIVEGLDAETITVDRLTEHLKEAVGLLAICRRKLGSTEKEVQEILDGLG